MRFGILASTRLLVLCSLSWTVCGNTEIVNFVADSGKISAAELEELDSLTEKWPALEHGRSDSKWEMLPAPLGTPLESVCLSSADRNSLFLAHGSSDSHDPEFRGCPHELWLRLNLAHEAWEGYSKFTLRLSWPASFPTDFSVQVYDAAELHDHLAQYHMLERISSRGSDSPRLESPRTKYARIRLVDTGVRTPQADSQASPPAQPSTDKVPFVLVLEPLYFGVLPASVTPVLVFILPILAFAAIAVPKINAYMERLARDARRDFETKLAGSKKQE